MKKSHKTSLQTSKLSKVIKSKSPKEMQDLMSEYFKNLDSQQVESIAEWEDTLDVYAADGGGNRCNIFIDGGGYGGGDC
jgi:hypothetical protein